MVLYYRMPTSLLEGDLAAAITEALTSGDVPYAVTVTRSTPGEVDPDEPWVIPTPVLVAYDARGWEENYTADELDNTTILSTDVRVVVLLSTIAKATGASSGAPATIMPAVGDGVTVRGKSYSVISVQTDPALATVSLQVRA